ncbi:MULTISPECIES: TetR/AcrR family transcriptional regulator [unclassified Isoptericola]|uniref:TetR/AcrR family transcriptional regulator n=1 Tax=unclassified Isoptericola TaxID=2623355 RepID=UPI0036679795
MDDVEEHVRRLWRHRGAEPAPARRGPRRRLELDEVLDAAVAVADADGLDGLSTRAVGARLGLSAMGLYPYVGTKEQLLALAEDHASAMPGWRDPGPDLAADLDAWAGRLFALYREHPWLVDLPWASAPGGPQQQDWLERLLDVLARHDVPPASRAAVVTALYAVVRATAQTAAEYERLDAAGAEAWRERAAATRRLVPDLDERYPRAAALAPHATHDWRDAPRAAVRHVVDVLCHGLAPGAERP